MILMPAEAAAVSAGVEYGLGVYLVFVVGRFVYVTDSRSVNLASVLHRDLVFAADYSGLCLFLDL